MKKLDNATLSNLEACENLNPHESLPSDIWLHIFHKIVQESVSNVRNMEVLAHRTRIKGPKVVTSLKEGHLPIILSHVCHGWHSLVTSYPPLWANIFINALTRSPHSMLELWLTRSASMELSIWFDAALAPHTHPDEFKEEVMTCLRTLKDVSQRWKLISFYLYAETWKICNDVFPPQCGLTMNLSRLETVEAAIVQAPESSICHLVGLFYTPESPNIRNVRIGDRFSDSSYDLPHIPEISKMTSVVSLILESQIICQMYELVRDLALITQLQELEIYDCPTFFYEEERRHRIVIPNLVKLTVTGWLAWVGTKRFLYAVSLPSLRDLTVGPKFEVEALDEMLAASGSRLKRLSVTQHPQYPDWSDLRSLLASSAAEQLQELTLVSKSPDGIDIMELDLILVNVNISSLTPQNFPFSLVLLTFIGWHSSDGRISQLGKSLLEYGSLRYLYVEVFPGTLDSYEKDYAAIRRWQSLGFDAHLRQRT